MDSIKKAFKEWNAIVEALGQGKQTIVIRKNQTSNKQFLLYPTVNYAIKEDFLDYFKKDTLKFVKNHALPKKEDSKTEIKFFANVEQVIEASPRTILNIKDHYIWNTSHVHSYLGKKGYIWILRIYKLKTPYMVQNANGLTFTNLSEKISILGSKAVLSDKEFEIENKAIKKQINS